MAVTFLTFDLEHLTLTLGEGHRIMLLRSSLPQGTIVRNLMYVALIVSGKNGKVTFWWHLTVTFVTLTLSEGHRTTYNVMCHITKYL